MANSQPLRPAIEQRLSLPQHNELWAAVKAAFAADDWEEERDYWAYAVGLRDSWSTMSKAPAKEVERTVAEIAALSQQLANKITAFSPEIQTLTGYLDIDRHTFMAEDLKVFAAGLHPPGSPTEAMASRPRSMMLPTAERTYLARALTHFILSGSRQSGLATLVAMTVNALLDVVPGSTSEIDAKGVRDLTEDIVARYRNRELHTRSASKVLGF